MQSFGMTLRALAILAPQRIERDYFGSSQSLRVGGHTTDRRISRPKLRAALSKCSIRLA